MASILVRRDQFNITPQGITHKPTDAYFAPHCGDPFSGSIRLGQLENVIAIGERYDPDQVKKMMMELWAEYVTANSSRFNEQLDDAGQPQTNEAKKDGHADDISNPETGLRRKASAPLKSTGQEVEN
jgi:hypothetical protein